MISTLSLDQLRVLVTIADTGSFSAAGRKLRRVQSAISQTVAALEANHGVTLFDRSAHRPQLSETGRVLVQQARMVLASAARFEAVAANSRQGTEAELTLAIDPLVPTAPLIFSLRALREIYPQLQVSFSTEGLGGALRRLRSGDVALAFCLLLPDVPEDVTAAALMRIDLVPVAAAGHPLATLGRPLTGDDLQSHVQLVLSDPTSREGPNYGLTTSSPWRFVDLGRRLDFLLEGFGWCRMPHHLVRDHLKTGRLVRLVLDDQSRGSADPLTIYAAYSAGRPPGPAGYWLLQDLAARLMVN